MSDHIVTFNAGSSSIKFALFANEPARPRLVATGQIDGLGADVYFKVRDAKGTVIHDEDLPESEIRNHAEALAVLLAFIARTFPEARIAAVGHRVVHGGPHFSAPVVIDDKVLEELRAFIPLAPLHQPHNIAGILATEETFPGVPQVACFDTAFHRGHDFVNETYGLPRRFYDEGVRRYGFHGLSYEFVTRRLAEIAPQDAAGRVVIAHLGNGASMCAVRAGRSLDSTMGFSVLEGLPMGTRCGEIDPGVLLHLLEQRGLSVQEVSDLLYKNAGLKGMSGLSHDMRELEAAGTPEARDAIAYFVARIRRNLGSLAAVLGGLDALVFTGGIGENAGKIRAEVLRDQDWLGLVFDAQANDSRAQVITAAGSPARSYVIATSEEEMIAEHTRTALGLAPVSRAAE